jgi:hypothetical protein
MNAQSKPLELQPIEGAVPSFQHSEGEFVFVAINHRAANEPRLDIQRYREFASDGCTDWNVAMFLCTAVLLIGLAALLASIAILAGSYVDPIVAFMYDVPAARGYGLAGALVTVLGAAMVLRLRRIAPGALA